MAAKGRLGDYTVEQRVLIHLSEHRLARSRWEGKAEQTQSGIAASIGISRKHLPRTLKSLMAQDLVEMETRHVPGNRQRCRIYYLTPSGVEAAAPMHTSIGEKVITHDGKSTTISELAKFEIPYLEVLAHLNEEGVYDSEMHAIEIEDEGTGTNLYRRVLHRAWGDGIITDDERGMLDDISIHLGLEPDAVETIEKEVNSERVVSQSQQNETFLEVLAIAWLDGYISSDEQAMLNTLAESLGIGSEEADLLQKNWISENS